MATIKEDYVSFEVAKLLKEKGFDEPCFGYYNVYYDPHGKDLKLWRKFPHGMQANTDYLNVPTHQMAIKWLREKYNIYICIQPDFPSSKDYKMYWCWSANILHDNCVSLKGYQCYIETYEKATEEAIKCCLENLI